MSDEDLPPLPAHLDPRKSAPRRRRTTKAREADPPAAAASADSSTASAESSTVGAGPSTVLESISRRQRRLSERASRRVLLRLARTIAAALALSLLVASGLAFTYYNRLSSQAGTAGDVETIENNEADEGFDGEALDILMIGTDGREGTDIPAEEEGGLHNTDTMMLIHVPADGSAASVVSFPRDSYVELPTGEFSKLNSAYSFGYNSLPETATEQQRKDAGQTNLIQTINILSGVQIDHFVEVTLAGFKELTQAVGGVEVNLCEAVDEPQSGAKFPAGKQRLNADQALAFVRQRYGLKYGDLDRIKRQQYFMGAMLREVLDQQLLDLFNIGKLTALIDALANTINYDPGLDPLALAEQMRDIAAGNVEFRTIPVVGDDFVPGIGDVILTADEPQMKQFFLALSQGEPSPETASSSAQPPALNPADIVVDVYDGSQTPGLFSQASAGLSAAGFSVNSIGPAQTSDYQNTEVQYAAAMQAQASAVAAAIPGAVLVENAATPEGKVLVIVGASHGTATTQPTPQPDAPDSTAADTGCIY